MRIPCRKRQCCRVLKARPVLAEPEPLVLVEKLGSRVQRRSACVLLVCTRTHNWLKLKSSLIRLVKRALDEGGFTLPDATSTVIFASGVPVQPERTHVENGAHEQPTKAPPPIPRAGVIATDAEGDLGSEEKAIQAQAQRPRPLDEGEDLLKTNHKQAARETQA